MSVRVGLVGCGVWGANVLRVLADDPRAEVVAVADLAGTRREVARGIAPRARWVPSLDEALGVGIDAVVIATPPESHAELTLRALDAGADVLVEKPLALAPADAERCAARAAALGRIAMVGHLLRYHPAVTRLLDLCESGDLGEPRRFSATRRSFRAPVGALDPRATLWALGPHDLAVLGALDPSPLRDIAAHAEAPPGESIALTARLESGLRAKLTLCRTSPVKERWTRVTGTRRVAWFDEVRSPDRILLATTRGRSLVVDEPLAIEREIRLDPGEPLALEVAHFLRCVEERTPPRTPLSEGTAVVRALARAEATLTPHAVCALASPL